MKVSTIAMAIKPQTNTHTSLILAPHTPLTLAESIESTEQHLKHAHTDCQSSQDIAGKQKQQHWQHVNSNTGNSNSFSVNLFHSLTHSLSQRAVSLTHLMAT